MFVCAYGSACACVPESVRCIGNVYIKRLGTSLLYSAQVLLMTFVNKLIFCFYGRSVASIINLKTYTLKG